MAQAQRLQDLESGLDLLHRVGRQRDPDCVADSGPEQRANADGGFHRAAAQAPGLGNAEMQRVIAGLGQAVIGGDRQENVGGLNADLEFPEVVVFQNPRMVQAAFDHSLWAGLAVTLQQLFLQRAGIDADTHGTAMVACRLDHLAHPLRLADIAGIDAQAGRARLRRFNGALVVEMDVGDDRHRDIVDDRLQRRGRCLVGARDSHDIGPGLLQRVDLADRRLRVVGRRIGHGLHRDRCIAADGHVANHDAAGFPPLNFPIGPNAHLNRFQNILYQR